MTDQELLESAARAARMRVLSKDKPWRDAEGWFFCEVGGSKSGGMFNSSRVQECWNPLTDDGDALRLAVKLRIHIEWAFTKPGQPEQVQASPKGLGHCADIRLLGDDPYATLRRTITSAAAEIGKTMDAPVVAEG